MRDGVIEEDLRENEGKHAHHDQGIEQGPEDPQGHVAVADFEVLLDKVREDEAILTSPHRR